MWLKNPEEVSVELFVLSELSPLPPSVFSVPSDSSSFSLSPLPLDSWAPLLSPSSPSGLLGCLFSLPSSFPLPSASLSSCFSTSVLLVISLPFSWAWKSLDWVLGPLWPKAFSSLLWDETTEEDDSLLTCSLTFDTWSRWKKVLIYGF